MKRILFLLFLFALSINVILAQVATINIATPNSNGFSNNSVNSFYVNSDGTILNNSAVDGTAQLGSTAVTAHPNISAGSEADLILFQVTGSSGSGLNGTIEVFGEEAGLIIANPNGITCNGCGFINTNRVDLVTGSGYDALTDRFGTIAAADITVMSGGLDASSVAVLNIQTGADFNNSTTIDADNFNVTAADDFFNSYEATINAGNFNVTADDFYNRDSATISADSLNISYNSFDNKGIITDGITYYFGNVFIENVNNLSIVPDGTTLTDAIQSSSGIDIINIARPDSNGLSNNSYSDFNVLSSGLVFNNSSSAVSSSLAVTIAGNPNYTASDSASLILNQITSNNPSYLGGILEVAGDSAGIIIANPNGIVCDGCSFANTDKLDLITGTANFDTAGVISDYTTAANDVFIYNANIILRDFNVTAGNNFFNWDNSTISANLFNVTAGDDFYNRDNATISADNFNVTAYDFNNTYSAKIHTNNFNVTAGRFFYNQESATISANDFNVTAGRYFYNQDGATIDANDFNVTAEFLFQNRDSATISADNFNVTADHFSNYGSATINTNTFNIIADHFYNSATINTDTFNVIAGDRFYNSATINADNFNVTAYDFNNTYSAKIHTNNFNVTAGNDFRNYDNATIDANNFNVTAGDDFSNSATINADTVTIEVTNFDDDIYNTATISSDSLNIILTDDFAHISTSFAGFNNFNNLAITTDGNLTNNATINLAGVNLEITANTFINNGSITADTFRLSIAGDFDYGSDFLGNGNIDATHQNFTIRDGDFTNNTSIDLVGDLGITANNFFNTGGSITADTFALSVAGDFDYVADFNGTITTNSFNLNVGGDFSNNDSVNDFTWGTNDSLTVSGNADITTNNYIQSGAIDVAGALTINANSYTYNSSNSDFVLAENDSLTVLGSASVVADSFENSGTIIANNFNATVNTFVNEASATITANNFNATVNTFVNEASATITANNFNATVNTFVNEASATITALSCDIVHTTSYIDNGTVTCLDSATGDATVINIARTLSNGISNNSYATFHIPSNGVVFNNSVSDATSQLAGFISANPNYANGNAATLILAQITRNNISSLLFGALEVFGAEAGVIIANPSGIICNACSFLNASRVDLVTGSYNIPAGIYDVNEAAGINLSNGLDASSVAVLNIQAGSFTNTGGLKANSFNLYVAGNFDYADRGNVTASSFNLDVDGNFSNNDSNNNFILDSLTVSGNADITTNNYIQSGAIDVAGALTINANSYTYNSPNSDFVLAENDSLSISSGDFTITANNYIQFGTLEILEVYGALVIDAKRNFSNSGSIITAGSLEITAGHTAINQGSIVSNSLDITTDDFFRNLTGGDVDVATLNITAGGKVTNTANITVGTLNIIANNDSSRTNDTTGFYVSNRGNITATTLNIAAVDNFYNRGNITATDFNITRAKDIFFLNKEIDSFYAAGHTYDGGDISLSGDASFRADGGIIENYGNIDLGDFNLDISADSFINQASANISAERLNLYNVNSFLNEGVIDATIDQ